MVLWRMVAVGDQSHAQRTFARQELGLHNLREEATYLVADRLDVARRGLRKISTYVDTV